jgi:hypothetical protein
MSAARRKEAVPSAVTFSKKSLVLLSLVLLALMAGMLMVADLVPSAEPPPAGPPRTEFASDRGPVAAPVEFDAERAMTYLRQICAIGTRLSGSEGMKRQQQLLRNHFEELGGKVRLQPFTASQKSRRPEVVAMANLIVSWYPDRPRRIILCSHYDSRPSADQERDPRLWREPFLSANDGGSGVALMMELGHHMKDLPTKVGVDFVFFDGEEYVFDRQDEYFFGSKHFAIDYRKTMAQTRVQYLSAVLLDMVAGKNAHFPIEQNSLWKASKLVEEVWGIAEELKCEAFRSRQLSRVAVEDDHIPLNRAGIPAIDIIDFDYPHWHRLGDTPENCSGESMAEVARVLSVWVQRAR